MLRPIFIPCATYFCQVGRRLFEPRAIVGLPYPHVGKLTMGHTIKYTLRDINGLLLGGAYASSNQACNTAGADFGNDRTYTTSARYQNGPFVATASYLKVNHRLLEIQAATTCPPLCQATTRT
jgi:predicted porin